MTMLVLALVPTATATAQAQLPTPPASPVPAAGDCAGAGALPAETSPGAARATVLCLLNEQRVSNGLPGLRASRPLAVAATHWAQTMVSRHIFDHVSPSGSTLKGRVARAAYMRRPQSSKLGENIACGDGDEGTPAAIVDAWMASAQHRANILTPGFRDVGVGIVTGVPDGGSGATFVTDFGARR